MGRRVTVVGAGVIGLTSAVRLAEAGFEVDVLARELPLETTSATAGGLWLPFLAEPVEAVSRWARLTLDAFLDLAETDPGATGTGVAIRDGYLLGTGTLRPAWSEGLTRLELAAVTNPNPNHSHGWHLRVPLVDMTAYLPYLIQRLHAAGGTLTRLPLTALPSRGLVVNCTGLASRALADDPSMHPIRGQVVWMTNPGLTTWWSDDTDPALLTYVLPHANHVVVGGTAEADDWSTTPDDNETARIVARAVELVPALRAASVLSHRVGLRPGRPAVRLETVSGPQNTVVHCYGHGGSGVTLSWGCADDVLAAVRAVADTPVATD
jgi:D-amino-acid oxidase